jgi:phosphate transport system permease protein
MSTVSEIVMQKVKMIQRNHTHAQSNLETRRLTQKIAFGALWLTGGLVIFVLFFVIVYLLLQSGKFFIGAENMLEAAAVQSSNEEVRAHVAATPNTIGYLSLGYLDDTIKPLALNGVAPTVDNIIADKYPIVRDLYMVANGEPSPNAQAWLDFVRSREGQAIVEQAGYIALQDAASFQLAAENLAGELTLAGSTTMQPLAEALAQAFVQHYSAITVSITGSDSTLGVREVGREKIDLAMSSRDLNHVEISRYRTLNIFPVAHDGIAIVAHPSIPVDSLTYNQARDIFTGFIDNWKAVGGPDAPIVVLTRESGSGTLESFEYWVLRKDKLMDHGFATGDVQMVAQGLSASLTAIWRFLTTRPLPGMGGKGGTSTTIITTAYMVILTLLIAAPVGVGAAVYLVEYAGEMGMQNKLMRQIVEIIRFTVETLAGVPSIIFGLFGFALFVTILHLGLSMLSGALAGACLILPVIIRTSEEALLTVPRAYREGSLALGATKWQTNWQVVLPTAMPGIVTGIILGIGRVVSETAVFYVTLGGSIHLPTSIKDQGRTMVLHLYSLMMDANAADPAMGTAMVLVVTIVVINLAINYFSKQLSIRMSGKAR